MKYNINHLMWFHWVLKEFFYGWNHWDCYFEEFREKNFLLVLNIERMILRWNWNDLEVRVKSTIHQSNCLRRRYEWFCCESLWVWRGPRWGRRNRGSFRWLGLWLCLGDRWFFCRVWRWRKCLFRGWSGKNGFWGGWKILQIFFDYIEVHLKIVLILTMKFLI